MRGFSFPPTAGDVEEVVDWVVDQVPAEAGDGEASAVAAPAAPLPLIVLHVGEGIGQARRGR